MQKLFEQGAMDGSIEIDASSLESMEQVEGATHVYEVTRANGGLDDATKAVLEMFREAAN